MKLECTKKLLGYLGIKPEKTAADVEKINRWICCRYRKCMPVRYE